MYVCVCVFVCVCVCVRILASIYFSVYTPDIYTSIRGGGSKYALVRQNKTLVGDFVANLRTVCHLLTNIL